MLTNGEHQDPISDVALSIVRPQQRELHSNRDVCSDVDGEALVVWQQLVEEMAAIGLVTEHMAFLVLNVVLTSPLFRRERVL